MKKIIIPIIIIIALSSLFLFFKEKSSQKAETPQAPYAGRLHISPENEGKIID